MPVSLKSRYHGNRVYDCMDKKGETHPTLELSLKYPEVSPGNVFIRVLKGTETLETLAWDYYGSSTDWWRIADACPLIFPLDIRSGTSIPVPRAADVGRVVRTRRFRK